jgi:hypothetical protein
MARLKPCPSSDDSSAARRARIVAFEFFRLGRGLLCHWVDAGASVQSQGREHRGSRACNFEADYFGSAVWQLELAAGDFEGKLELQGSSYAGYLGCGYQLKERPWTLKLQCFG